MEVKLLRITDAPVDCIELAASQCYNSVPSEDGRIMRNCIRSGHLSVTEHVYLTFEVKGVSRALLAQLSRHRLQSLSVQSQRYVSYKEGFDYVTPPGIKALGAEAVAEFDAQMAQIAAWYRGWQDKLGGEKEKSNEDARAVLPNACCTNLVVSMNLRVFAHECNERCCARAQTEIRQLFKEMVRLVNEATNNAWKDYLVPKCEIHKGYCFCTESKSQTCGRHPLLSDIFVQAAIGRAAQLQEVKAND